MRMTYMTKSRDDITKIRLMISATLRAVWLRQTEEMVFGGVVLLFLASLYTFNVHKLGRTGEN